MTALHSVDIAVIGSINADTTYHVAHLPGPGETILGTGRLDAPGGKGANQAAAVAALGASVDFVAAIGPDDAGDSLVSSLATRGVGIDHVVTLNHESTGSAVIFVADSGENSIVVHPGANGRLRPEHVETYFVSQQPAVVMAQLEIPLETVAKACSITDATVIINPAPMPPRSELLDAIIARADILVPNRGELAVLAGTEIPHTPDDVVAAARTLAFSGQLVVTLGHEGAMVFPDGVHGDPVVVPAPDVDAVDTSGAGDAFCGALAVGIQAGKSLVDAVASANEFASWSVTQRGAQVPGSTSQPTALSH